MAEQTPTAAPAKLKVGMFWAASCGGCDISLLEIGPRLLDLIAIADVVFWPCAADFKYRDVAAYPDGHIDVCFYTGGIRNSEQEEVARLLRRKSKCLVAYGACSGEGGIPALAAVGALITAILVVNNLRDIAGDARAGRRTLAVILGPAGARLQYALLVLGSYAAPIALLARGDAGPRVLLPLASLPLAARLIRAVYREEGRALNRVLAGSALLALLFSVLLAAGVAW